MAEAGAGVGAVGAGTGAVEGVEKKSPSDFLRHVIGRPVIVKLVSGITYHGVLAW